MGKILNDWTYRKARAKMRKAETRKAAATLAGSIAGYETLRAAGWMSLELRSLNELGLALIRGRVARGWTQEKLAQVLSMPKQQVQRYEATEYSSASLRRVVEVAEALGISVRGAVESGPRPEAAFDLARSLAGYAAVAAVQEVERRFRLRTMTSEEVRKVFDDLYDTYYRLAPLHRDSIGERPKVASHRLKVRRAIAALAHQEADRR